MVKLLVPILFCVFSVVLAAHNTVRLRLFTGNVESYIQANSTDADILIFNSSSYDKNLKTVLMIHGFISNSESSGPLTVVDAFISRRNLNVIAVDWRDLAFYSDFIPNLAAYPRAASNTKVVGEAVSDVLNKAIAAGQLFAENVTCVGHSLGAQSCGAIGRRMTKKPAAIIGLDPAGPLFEWFAVNKAVSKEDADIVHLVHTDGGTLGVNPDEGKGTASFVFNGGSRNQPGCGGFFGLLDISCSHDRANSFFAEAIRDASSFIAVRCKNLYQFITGKCSISNFVSLRYPPSKSASGLYYLETNPDSKYGKSQDGLKNEYKTNNTNIFF